MLEVRGLRRTYGDLVAVRDVSFRLGAGEVMGLLGPNGAGKTTTVSMIAGLVTPVSGQVLIDGSPLEGDTDPKKRRIGMVPQDLALYDELSALANLRFFGALYDLGSAALEKAIESSLQLVGLTDGRATASARSAAGRAFFGGAEKPSLTMWYDPSHGTELGLVRGILTEHVMQSVSAEMFTGEQRRKLVDDTLHQLDRTTLSGQQQTLPRELLQSAQKFHAAPSAPPAPSTAAPARPRGITMPYTVAEEAITSGDNVTYNGFDAMTWRGLGRGAAVFPTIVLAGFALVFGTLAITRFRWEES